MSMQIQFIKQFFILKQHHFYGPFLVKMNRVHINKHILHAFKHNNTEIFKAKKFSSEHTGKKEEKCY